MYIKNDNFISFFFAHISTEYRKQNIFKNKYDKQKL